MLTLMIILVLLLGTYLGYRRGFFLQAVHILGYGISFALAWNLYPQLAEWLEILVPFPAVQPQSTLALYSEQMSFYLDDAFYGVLAFAVLLALGWIITQLLATLARPLMYYQMYYYVNAVAGAGLSFLASYTLVFIFLFILSLLPIEWVQQQFVNNPLAYWIVSQSPILSSWTQSFLQGVAASH